MSISAYIGLMGSGKSYEVVSSVIVPAVGSGRRVVTNIAGLNDNAIYDYLDTQKNLGNYGKIIHVKNDSVVEPNFFPEFKTDETLDDSSSIVKAGDLVCIDESWRFWGTDQKISLEHMAFFRMHRHAVGSDGHACDLVVMIQDLSTLHRSLRAVVELSVRMHKLKAVGSPKSYRVEMYEGYRLRRGDLTGRFIRRYNKDIFPLYSSYSSSSGTGSEKQVDKRQNIFSSKMLWFYVVVGVLIFCYSIYKVVSFFTPKTEQKKDLTPAQISVTSNGKSPSPTSSQSQYSSEYRIVGDYVVGTNFYVLVADSSGRVQVFPSYIFTGSGHSLQGIFDGKKVMYHTGTIANKTSASVVPQIK